LQRLFLLPQGRSRNIPRVGRFDRFGRAGNDGDGAVGLDLVARDLDARLLVACLATLASVGLRGLRAGLNRASSPSIASNIEGLATCTST